MWAIGALLVYVIYFILALLGFSFWANAYMSTERTSKILSSIAGLIFVGLIVWLKICQFQDRRQENLEAVGIYYLTNYPDCNSCSIELKEDLTYAVLKTNAVLETGDWHTDSYADFWATYLNGERDQLGSGKYEYKTYALKYPVKH